MADNLEQLKKQPGIIFDTKRFAIHDGPGIRTTVFLKGCNMTCWWCHNPESKGRRPEIFYFCTKCKSCGKCVTICPAKAHRIDQGEHFIDRDKCLVCGKCAEQCPVEAMKVIGNSRTAEDVLAEVLEDRHYYSASGGGVTISGGEPMMQADFVFALFSLARSQGVHTALDTNGNNGQTGYEKVLPVADLFLFDLKQMDEERHQQQTGSNLKNVLANLRWLSDHGAKIILRCPIIPELNAEDDSHWQKVAGLADSLPGVIGIEYLPYHRLWISKQNGLGLSIKEEKKSLPEITPERLDTILNFLNKSKKPLNKG
jgi:glycyl-radical enzyme activating protein